MKVSDTLTGLIFAAAGIGIALEAHRFPPVAGQPYGSAFFPTLIGIAMAIGGLVLAASAVFKGRARPLISVPAWLKSARGAGSFVLIIAALGFYMLLVDRLGFCATAFVLMLGLQKWMGARLFPATTIAAAATAAFYTVFAVLLRVPLPHGLVERFL